MEEQKTTNLGYTVTINKEGSIDFSVIGEPSPLELMGLHAFVGHKLHEPFVAELVDGRLEKVLEHIKGLYSTISKVVAQVASGAKKE